MDVSCRLQIVLLLADDRICYCITRPVYVVSYFPAGIHVLVSMLIRVRLMSLFATLGFNSTSKVHYISDCSLRYCSFFFL